MTSGMDRIAKLVDNPLLKEGGEIVSVDTSKIDNVDILPAHVDIALRDNFEEISFDDALILERMREEGLTEAQIAALQIHVSSEAISEGDTTYKGFHTIHDGRSKISLYPNASLDYYRTGLDQMAVTHPGQDFTKALEFGCYASSDMSQSLYHETRHEKQYRVDGNLAAVNEGYLRRVRVRYELGFVASSLLVMSGTAAAEYVSYGNTEPYSVILAGLFAIGGIFASYKGTKKLKQSRMAKDYEANPIEIDARKAGAEVQSDVVRLVPTAEVTASFRRG